MPLSPAEKQALLEAPDPPARQELLTALLEMNAGTAGTDSDGEDDQPPLVN
jgi:Lon protease-like protein